MVPSMGLSCRILSFLVPCCIGMVVTGCSKSQLDEPPKLPSSNPKAFDARRHLPKDAALIVYVDLESAESTSYGPYVRRLFVEGPILADEVKTLVKDCQTAWLALDRPSPN